MFGWVVRAPLLPKYYQRRLSGSTFLSIYINCILCVSSKIYGGRKCLKLAKNVKPGNCLPCYLHIGKGFNHPNSILRSIGRSFASPPEPELAPRLSLGCNSMQFKNSLLSADFICEWSRYFCLSELSSLEGRCLCA